MTQRPRRIVRTRSARRRAGRVAAIEALFALPFTDLMHRAQQTHRAHHAPNAVQLSTLLSIKTGGCPEDCGYCPQAKRYHTGVDDEALLDLDAVIAAARAAKAHGATRFCMGAAWRGPKERDLEPVLDMVREVKALGLETCATLGHAEGRPGRTPEGRRPRLLQPQPRHRARVLRRNRSPRATTRTGSTRSSACATPASTSAAAASSAWANRAASAPGLIAQLANLDPYPESVPINHLVQVEGTPLHAQLDGESALDPFEFVRTIAVARITMPKAMVRLSAGRRELGEAVQALCFLAGANSIFYGDKLLTTGNPDVDADRALFAKLGLATGVSACQRAPARRKRTPRGMKLIADLERGLADARGGRAAARAPHGRVAAGCADHGRRPASSSPSRATTTSASPTIRDVVAAARDGAARWGAGAGASHLICGHFAAHAALETALAGFVRSLRRRAGADVRRAAISPTWRSSPRSPGAATRSSPTGSTTRASTTARCCRARDFVRYPHRDLAHLRERLAASTATRKVIATDAVFSMDGDIAPLPGLLALADEFDAWLVVDDAHGFGVLGDGADAGRGTLAHFGLASRAHRLHGHAGQGRRRGRRVRRRASGGDRDARPDGAHLRVHHRGAADARRGAAREPCA